MTEPIILNVTVIELVDGSKMVRIHTLATEDITSMNIDGQGVTLPDGS